MADKWQFFRAGGVDQVSLQNASDLRGLAELDQKLWVALAMPTKDVDLDPLTLELLDINKDQRIRVLDIRAAIAWIEAVFAKPGDVLQSAPEVKLSAVIDGKVVAAAKRMLAVLGKTDAAAISVDDTIAITTAFANTKLNGDGIVIPESTEDLGVRQAIEDAIATVGSLVDRSGKPGIDKAKADLLFAEVDKRVAWLAGAAAASSLGAATEAAADAFAAVHAKLDDYFTRCRLVAFDPRAAEALGAQDTDLLALSQHSLTTADDDIARLPLAPIDPSLRLPIGATLNPGWAQKIATFEKAAVTPIVGVRDQLSPMDVEAIVTKLAPYTAWRAAMPTTVVDALEPARIAELAKPELRAKLAELIAADAALAEEYDQITSVVKAVRFQRDFGRILRNFVNFSDFYSRQDGVFQTGTLYIDARALKLCVPVSDAAKHAVLAQASDACLLYCEIRRDAETRQIVAALTNGDTDNIFPGRNGIFYDRKGNDWDATVVKVVSNPISIREAFWSPYKKLVKAVEDQVAKRAAAADAEANARLAETGKEVAHLDKVGEATAVPEGPAAPAGATPTPPPAATAPPAVAAAAAAPPEGPKKLDLGTIAAIGLAIGGVGTLIGALLATMFGLGMWMPIGIAGLLLAISGPAMLLAWLKLRRRNLGPILDANGWAINSRARINVPFGAAMTELAKLPPGSKKSGTDPFADKKKPWKLYFVIALIVVTAASWYFGKLDGYLPGNVKSTRFPWTPNYIDPSKPTDGKDNAKGDKTETKGDTKTETTTETKGSKTETTTTTTPAKP